MAAPVEALRCADAAHAEPLHATAPEEAAWLVVEQDVPWGRDAVVDSALAAVGAALSARAKAAGVRVLLVRRPRRRLVRRRVFLAWTHERPFLRAHSVARPEELLELDLDALARGEAAAGREVAEPLFLVCTNGRRDPCCAVRGCAAAAALRAALPRRTWECSHLGGHRFAATMLSLPSGACFGRLGPDDAVRAARSLLAGRLELAHLRGLAGRTAAAQAAEALVREELGLARLDDVRLAGETRSEAAARVELEARGARVAVELVPRALGIEQASCSGGREERTLWVRP